MGTFGDVSTAEKTYVQAKKMTEDLLKRVGNPEIKIVKEFVNVPVPRPSAWSKVLKFLGRGE